MTAGKITGKIPFMREVALYFANGNWVRGLIKEDKLAISPLNQSLLARITPIRIPLVKLPEPGFRPVTVVPFNDTELLDVLKIAEMMNDPVGVLKLLLAQEDAHI